MAHLIGDDKYSFSGVTETYENDADTIAAAIMKDGPVEAAFTVYSDFENYAGGKLKVQSYTCSIDDNTN